MTSWPAPSDASPIRVSLIDELMPISGEDYYVFRHEPLVPSDNTTAEGHGNMVNDQYDADWGERAMHWLRGRFVNWPMKAIARALDEPESVVVAWWTGINLPSRKKLQKLNNAFAKEGFTSFVFGAPSREEVTARLEALNNNLSELRALLNESNQRLAGPPLCVAGRTPRTTG